MYRVEEWECHVQLPSRPPHSTLPIAPLSLLSSPLAKMLIFVLVWYLVKYFTKS